MESFSHVVALNFDSQYSVTTEKLLHAFPVGSLGGPEVFPNPVST